MKYSYNWLKQLSGTKKSPQELADMLVMRAFEVESVESFGKGLENVVVGLVHSVEKHPNADKLNVAQVQVSRNPSSILPLERRGGSSYSSPLSKGGKEGGELRQIVCGALNLAARQKVVVALPGAKLPNGIEIKQAKIREVESDGMICSEKELGLGESHDGILVLPDDAEAGVSFAEYAGLNDTILDVKILPDRGGDALSYRGLAREIAALEGRRISKDDKKLPDFPENPINISIESEKCSRYAGILFEGVSEKSITLPFRSFLAVNGLRSISAPVDITNIFLLEYGQPMHAFDADKIEGKIVVRTAKDNESLELLDGATLLLHEEDLVIADEKKALALAGVMGGAQSAVTGETKNIFLEIATFDPVSIRRTRTRHKLATDASYRYERGLDPNLPGETFAKAIELFERECGAKTVGLTDVYPNPVEPKEIAFDPLLVSKMLGVSVEVKTVRETLEALGCEVKEQGNRWRVVAPTFRRDLLDEWNLVEEVARIYGYENIPSTVPVLPLSVSERNRAKQLERSLKNECVSSGFDEVMTYSFYGEEIVSETGVPQVAHLVLENPMNPEQEFMRAKLLPPVIEKAFENFRRFSSVRMFEFGSIYFRSDDGIGEEKRLAAVLSEEEKSSGENYRTLKGETERIVRSIGYTEGLLFRPTESVSPLFHPARTAKVFIGETCVGVCGEIHPRLLKKFGTRRAALLELSFSELLNLPKKETEYIPLPKFPYAIRDISLLVPRKTLATDLEQSILEAGSPLLKRCELFDIFESGETRNLAFHLSFGAGDRTITSEEMQDSFDRIVAQVEGRFSARLHE